MNNSVSSALLQGPQGPQGRDGEAGPKGPNVSDQQRKKTL